MTLEHVGGFPVKRYTHSERLGDIAIIGMMHVQLTVTPYNEVKTYLNNRHGSAGGTVHVEGVRDATYAELGRASKRDRRKYELAYGETDYFQKTIQALGYESQQTMFDTHSPSIKQI